MREDISLTLAERRILANQWHIRAKLEPEFADDFERMAEILEHGYELQYGEALCLWGEVPREICQEVLEILDMFRFLQNSFDNLEDKEGLTERDVVFRGFDGNEESKHLCFADFYCAKDRYGDLRFSGLGDGIVTVEELRGIRVNLNGHLPALGSYRRMLVPWLRIREERIDNYDAGINNLTAAQIREIVAERIHPSNRKDTAQTT